MQTIKEDKRMIKINNWKRLNYFLNKAKDIQGELRGDIESSKTRKNEWAKIANKVTSCMRKERLKSCFYYVQYERNSHNKKGSGKRVPDKKGFCGPKKGNPNTISLI